MYRLLNILKTRTVFLLYDDVHTYIWGGAVSGIEPSAFCARHVLYLTAISGSIMIILYKVPISTVLQMFLEEKKTRFELPILLKTSYIAKVLNINLGFNVHLVCLLLQRTGSLYY